MYTAPEFVGQLAGANDMSTGTLALSAAASATAWAVLPRACPTKVPAGCASALPAYRHTKTASGVAGTSGECFFEAVDRSGVASSPSAHTRRPLV